MSKKQNNSGALYPPAIGFIYKGIDVILSIARMLALSKLFQKTPQIKRNSDRCIVLGNGPSLSKSLSDNKDKLNNYDLIALNHFGVSDEYVQYKPSVYVLCDPAFWYAVESDNVKEKTKRLYDSIIKLTDWDMQLYLPHLAKKRPDVIESFSQNKHITIKFYNKTKFEGFDSINHYVYDRQWGMPRAQNIVIASLMLLIYSQYKEVYLFGTENDSFRYLWVDNNNCLRYSYQHFYKESAKETDSVVSDEKLYEQFASLYITYKNYTHVETYARQTGVDIYNATPNSCIDAFRRKNVPNE